VEEAMSYEAYLAHHGIKGQKWGVRRFQDKSGKLTSEGAQRQRLRRRVISRDKTNPEINKLVRSMSDEDKARIGLDKGQEYTNHDESVTIARRETLRRGKEIVAFCDAFVGESDFGVHGKTPVYIAIGTSPEQQHRGKGYATAVAKRMQNWFDSQDEFDEVIWSARKDNVASQRIAEKLGFEYSPTTSSDTWVEYTYSKKRRH
jgi:RimJ/RimL family protein N-acetyltransferase